MNPDADINADPYSWAMVRIVGTLDMVDRYGRDGTMSEAEFDLIKGIRKLIHDTDSWALDIPTPRSIVVRP